MNRIPITPRANWQEIVKKQGLLFYQEDAYYNENAAYEFSQTEVDAIRQATDDLYKMCLAVVEYVIKNKLCSRFLIQEEFVPMIEWSWKTGQPSFYGRFDLACNNGQIKLLEFNADTPTLLLESSAIQWFWLRDTNPDKDQYNRIHEKLIETIRSDASKLNPGPLYFSADYNHEDFATTKYMQDVAIQAGLETAYINIDDIGINDTGRFVDNAGNPISNIFKIYPWEWMFAEPFGKYLDVNKEACRWIEPAWKAILSNKMLLPCLYELFPDSPLILPAIFHPPDKDLTNVPWRSCAIKPVFSREGANVTLIVDDRIIESNEGEYGIEGHIIQQYTELPDLDGYHPIIGSWVIGGEPAGMGIRESLGRITGVTSSFCPHYIV